MGKQTVINQVESCLRFSVTVASEKEIEYFSENEWSDFCCAIYMTEISNMMPVLL